ncbi:MAG TPA: carbohydrate ABC transporter permease [Bryobacteraceae bacterium]|jgi:multiple sugar transport system permease protein|nr:carbohydrate ABC transporter permease [Bryobacteraceae bacterium]
MMRARSGWREAARKAAALLPYLAAVAAVFIALAPVYWLLTISLKREVDQFAYPPQWIGFTATLEHYRDAFAGGSFAAYFENSVLLAAISTIAALAIGVPAAYGLARFEWPRQWDHRIADWILSTRMLPPIVTIVPLFLMLRQARLLNSLIGLAIVYTGFNLPFVVWMMRGFFEEVPKEIEEAAMLDGESRSGALLRIVLPLVRPGLAATAVFCLVVAWNEFLFALILTQTEAAMTLPVGIASRVTQYEIKWGAMSAAGVVAMIPVLVFAAAAQKYLVRGLSLGAVKG